MEFTNLIASSFSEGNPSGIRKAAKDFQCHDFFVHYKTNTISSHLFGSIGKDNYVARQMCFIFLDKFVAMLKTSFPGPLFLKAAQNKMPS